MASIVLSGNETTTSVAWTNNTGENVRIIINFLSIGGSGTGGGGSMNWGGGATISFPQRVIMGRNIAAVYTSNANGLSTQNVNSIPTGSFDGAPTELALANGDTFSLTNSVGSSVTYIYNILIIPESG